MIDVDSLCFLETKGKDGLKMSAKLMLKKDSGHWEIHHLYERLKVYIASHGTKKRTQSIPRTL